jgi:UDP-2,4-diacetamido-2,4,6-trideoxy-beta-L-altropyranose hydrolase
MRVAFRCDASAETGLGHLARCLTLADELKGRGAECVLVVGGAARHKRRVTDRGHRFAAVEPVGPGDRWMADAEATLALLPWRPDWLVADHYGLDRRWHQRSRSGCGRIAVIDDLADRPHDCDLLIDHNPGNLGCDRYEDLVPADAGRALGPRHALIGPAYCAMRGQARPRDGSVRRILLFITAGDDGGRTQAVLSRLKRGRWAETAVDVVSSTNNPRLPALISACGDRPGTMLHVDAGNLAEIASRADIAVGAAGGAALERCCLGLPTATLVIAPNQQPGALALERLRAVICVEDDADAVVATLARMADEPGQLAALGHRGAFLVDGEGPGRVARLMAGGAASLHLRDAISGDAELLHSWRNDPAVRAVSLQQDPIGLDQHKAWLGRLLADPERQLLIAMSGATPVGTIRFDHAEHGVASVSLTVAPGYQGRGLGGALLCEGELWAIARRPSTRRFEATVLSGNLRSRALFGRAGYATISEQETRLIYSKPCSGGDISLSPNGHLL